MESINKDPYTIIMDLIWDTIKNGTTMNLTNVKESLEKEGYYFDIYLERFAYFMLEDFERDGYLSSDYSEYLFKDFFVRPNNKQRIMAMIER